MQEFRAVLDHDVIEPHLHWTEKVVEHCWDVHCLMHTQDDGFTTVGVVICQCSGYHLYPSCCSHLGIIPSDTDSLVICVSNKAVLTDYACVCMTVEFGRVFWVMVRLHIGNADWGKVDWRRNSFRFCFLP